MLWAQSVVFVAITGLGLIAGFFLHLLGFPPIVLQILGGSWFALTLLFMAILWISNRDTR